MLISCGGVRIGMGTAGGGKKGRKGVQEGLNSVFVIMLLFFKLFYSIYAPFMFACLFFACLFVRYFLFFGGGSPSKSSQFRVRPKDAN